MNKKGFTLVELLAVIAILAILVIIAVPNVLETLSTSRKKTFENEVASYMTIAAEQFVSDSIVDGEKAIVYTSNTAVQNAETLKFDGAAKNYYIALDRKGNFLRVYVADESYCFDSGAKKDTDAFDKGETKNAAKDSTPTDAYPASTTEPTLGCKAS